MQKKKSIVAIQNSWKPFIDEIENTLKAKDFRRKSIVFTLSVLDPDISCWPGSLTRYLVGQLIGPGFFLGREALYGKIFDSFLSKNRKLFRGAPLLVLQTFNTMVTTLFSNPKPRLLDLNLARKTYTEEEKILKRGERATKHLVERTLAHAKQQETPPHEEPEEEEEIQGLTFEKKKKLFSHAALIDPSVYKFFETEGSADEQCALKIEEASERFSNYVQLFFSSFPSSSYGPFVDLHAYALATLPQYLSFTEAELQKLLSINEEQQKTLILTKEQEAKKPFESILNKANELQNLIETIEKEKNSLKILLEPFLKKKDTQDKVEILLSELSLLTFEKQLLEVKTEVLEAELRKRREKIQSLLRSFETEFKDLLSLLRKLECVLDEARWSIVFSRFELFSRKQPYPDLIPLLEKVRVDLTSTLQAGGQELIIGKHSIHEIIDTMLDAAYAHNVKLLRGEILARSLRLKDIRERVEREFCVDSTSSWLFNFFSKLIHPFTLFQNASSPESINILFRYFWIDLDRWKKYAHVPLQKTKEHTHLLEQMKKLMLFPNAKELLEKRTYLFDLLMCIEPLPYKEREERLLRLKAIEEKKNTLIECFKAVQAVKTFEPERIDAILEALALLQVHKSAVDAWLHYMETVLEKMEEELFCELSFLDTRGRLRPGSAIQKLQEQITPLLPHIITYMTHTLSQLAETSIIARFFQKLIMQQEWNDKDFFNTCHTIGHFIIYKRVLQSTSFCAKALLLPPLLNYFFLQTSGDEQSEQLVSYLRGFFDLFFPEFSKERMLNLLKEFLLKATVLYKNNEALLACDEIRKALESEEEDFPLIFFIPGDLSFFG